MCLLQRLDCAKGMLMNLHFQVSEVRCGNLYNFLRIDALEIGAKNLELKIRQYSPNAVVT
jgi:hypothetical protein